MERWGAARDILSFFASVGHLGKTAGGLADYMLGSNATVNVGGENNADGTGKMWKAMGLDATLPEVWGKTSFLPHGDTWSQAYDRIWDSYNNTSSSSAVPSGASVDQAASIDAAATNLGSIWAEKNKGPKDIANASLVKRVGVSALKVLSATSDLAGFADIVTGAIGIKDSMANGDTVGIVGNSLNVGGGVALSGAAVIATAGLWATLPAKVLWVGSGLFLAGSVLSFAGMIALEVVQVASKLKQLHSISEDQSQWFQDLANDGLADPEWADKLEYYRYAWTVWGNDNTEADTLSYIDFQAAEWNVFKDEEPTGGTSLYRLDKESHVHTHLTNTVF